MAEYRVPYGKSEVTFSIPDDYPVSVIAPRDIAPADDITALVRNALADPVGDIDLARYAGARSVAIAISDKTRPIPHTAIVPLLDHLAELGIADDAITFLIATGTHLPMTFEEFPAILPGDMLRRYRVISHDCDAPDLVYLGETQRGTPVYANRHFVEADLRIGIGNLEPHQFMGFSGGVKIAAIGLAGRETINTNHAMMIDPRSELGSYDDNPTRQDLEDIGRLMHVDFALNFILNRHKQVVRALAGDPLAVMHAGIPLARDLLEVPVAEAFDLVIASPGGYPKDINLYQAQKALSHAARVTRTGGHVILAAACSEGVGSDHYEEWVSGMESHAAVITRFKSEPFRLGPHKAFQIARDAVRVQVQMVSEIAPEYVAGLLLDSAPSVQAAIDTALDNLRARARVGVLPAANSTIPTLTAT